MTHIFRSPKYQKELRKRNKSDQAISNDTGIPTVKPRAPDPGPKLQATSTKRQAPSESNSEQQASSPKQQASSSKPQASSSMIREPRNI